MKARLGAHWPVSIENYFRIPVKYLLKPNAVNLNINKSATGCFTEDSIPHFHEDIK